jgi:SAM-dependent methyltransferase
MDSSGQSTLVGSPATLRERLDRYWYPQLGRNWDDTLFREVLLGYITDSSVVLDVGAGAGIIPQMNFKGKAARVCGVDLDPRVVDNPFLDEGIVGKGEKLPYADETFDVVFSDNVFEHLPDPAAVFAEVKRVLKKGGYFISKTPNRFHYVPVLAQLTPLWFHKFFNSLRGRETEDTFPTLYRANSERAVNKLAVEAGFSVKNIRLVEGRPEYLRFSVPSYFAGIAYERLVNSTEMLRHLRVILISVLQK